jgi:hypothetical protein
MTLIKNYDEIKLIKNALLILDIDETILRFEGITYDWFNNIEKEWKLTNDIDRNKYVQDVWINTISKKKPIILDQKKFDDMINDAKSINCKLIFLTARDPLTISKDNTAMTKITEDNLKSCIDNVQLNDIYYSKSKGNKILEILKEDIYSNISDIIFVDDLQHNLDDVNEAFKTCSNFNLHLYLIKHENNVSSIVL